MENKWLKYPENVPETNKQIVFAFTGMQWQDRRVDMGWFTGEHFVNEDYYSNEGAYTSEYAFGEGFQDVTHWQYFAFPPLPELCHP